MVNSDWAIGPDGRGIDTAAMKRLIEKFANEGAELVAPSTGDETPSVSNLQKEH